MSNTPVNLSSGLGETVLPEVSAALSSGLTEALATGDPRHALGEIIRQDPTYLEAWAALSASARDNVEAFAYARVGYHRGLDALRKAGWRGSGYVRWSHPSNRGFLKSLRSLELTSAELGDLEEAERCALFIRQCDPQINIEELDASR